MNRDSSAEGKTIAGLDLKTRYGIADCCIRRNNAIDVVADATTRLKAGDALDRLLLKTELSGKFPDCSVIP